MSETRITGAEVRLMHFKGGPWYETGRFIDRLKSQLDADAQRLADLEAENAALWADAAEYQALQAVIGHPMRDPRISMGHEASVAPGYWWAFTAKGDARIDAPTPSALLARLDALAEARKPKAEVWRWRRSDGQMGSVLYPSPDDCRDGNSGEPGHPVREVRNAAGDILLLREGRPIPTEGGPWT